MNEAIVGRVRTRERTVLDWKQGRAWEEGKEAQGLGLGGRAGRARRGKRVQVIAERRTREFQSAAACKGAGVHTNLVPHNAAVVNWRAVNEYQKWGLTLY